MAYPSYLRDRARQLRTEKHLSLTEIAAVLALPKTTVYYWIKDLPLGRPRRQSPGQRIGHHRMCANYKRLRDEAYSRGAAEYDELISVPTFRDFVVLYIAEGYKKNRNTVQIGNSDPTVVVMSKSWLGTLTARKLLYSIQYHLDQDLSELQNFWGEILGIDGGAIRMQRKSNSGQLKGRRWRSAHGVLSIRVFDTYLRSRLQAWMDRIRQEWHLDSADPTGRGAAW
jgi:hypothetical protein